MRNMGLIRPRRWKRLVIYAIVSVTTFYVVLSMTSNNNHSPFQDKYEFDDSVIQALKKKPEESQLRIIPAFIDEELQARAPRQGVLIAYSEEGESIFTSILQPYQDEVWQLRILFEPGHASGGLCQRALACQLSLDDLRNVVPTTDSCQTFKMTRKLRCLNVKCKLKKFVAVVTSKGYQLADCFDESVDGHDTKAVLLQEAPNKASNDMSEVCQRMRADIETASLLDLKYPGFHLALFVEDFRSQWEGHVKSLTSFLHLPSRKGPGNPLKNEANSIANWKTLFTICIMESFKEF